MTNSSLVSPLYRLRLKGPLAFKYDHSYYEYKFLKLAITPIFHWNELNLNFRYMATSCLIDSN